MAHLNQVQKLPFEPCLFPTLVGTTSSLNSRQSAQSPLEDGTKLHEFCVQHGLKTLHIFQVAWALVLQSYVGTDSICFGCQTSSLEWNMSGAGADHLPLSKTIFYYPRKWNTESIVQILKNLAAGKDSNPGQSATPHAGTDLDGSRGPLFNTTLLIQRHISGGSVDSKHHFLEALQVLENENLDIVMNIDESSQPTEVYLSYPTAQISELDASNIVGTFNRICSTIVANPFQRVEEIELLSSRDRKQLFEWNKAVPRGERSCVHELIEQIAFNQPELQAISSWDGSLTYSELDDLSSKLAFHLVCLGVKPEIIVPLYFEKSMWAIVSVIAVLKAGGAYVFLNPMHPVSRTKVIIEEVEAKIVLVGLSTSADMVDIVNHIIIVDTVFIKTLSAEPELQLREATLRTVIVSPENRAYIVFTSGSTGKPKGIVQEHGSACVGIRDYITALQLDKESRVLQFAAYSFDATNNDILTTLASGGCLCIPSEHDRVNNLAQTIRDMNVNVVFLTPTIASLLLPHDVPGLRTLLLAGEPVTKDIVRVWASKVRLVNIYGPSECSIWCTYRPQMINTNPANVGRPVTARCWIVGPNNHKRLVPLGSIGELLFEGPNVARGYINDEVKTRASFITQPRWSNLEPNYTPRFYLTGDLVRYDPDGSLVFVGRKDTQVKIHGHRVELGEVEYHLKNSVVEEEGLGFAVDIIRPESLQGSRGPMLAAFISFSNVATKTGEIAWAMRSRLAEIKGHFDSSLKEILPTYTVPSVYIPIGAMPLTVSGKTDRLRLRQLGAGITIAEIYLLSNNADDGTVWQAPVTEMEFRIRRLWTNVLNLAGETVVGRDESFLKLGGDSISAMRLVAAARDDHLSLNVADIFLNPTLRGMSLVANFLSGTGEARQIASFAMLGDIKTADAIRNEVEIACGVSKDNIEDVFPCTALQEGLMVLSIKQPGAYVAQHIIKLAKNISVERFRAAWENVVQTTPTLRTRIVQTDTGCYQAIVNENIDWIATDNLETYLHSDKKAMMDFGHRLSRFAIVKPETLEANVYYFVWTCHHALYDGWSLPQILARVDKNYYNVKSMENGSTRTTSFVQFVKHLSETNPHKTESFWRSYLCEATPSQFPRPTTKYQSLADSTLSQNIDLIRAASSDITVPTLIRAAWAILLSQHSDTNDVIFGATLTGRNAPIPGIDQILGPTITTVPVRIKVDAGQKLAFFLQDIQAQAIAMIPYEHTGLQNIRRLSPEVQVACDFQNLLVIQPQDDALEIDNKSLFGDLNLAKDSLNFYTYPLIMECTLTASGVIANATFDSKIIGVQQTRRVLSQLTYILQQLAVCDGEMQIQNIETISPQDKEEILNWNQAVPETINTCVHHLIEEQVQVQPNRPAVCSWDGNLIYRELDNLSSRLAYYLITLGVGPEAFVPLCFEKSMWTIVAMLGVMKAGGAFVHLDPSQPLARLQFILDEIKPAVVLTSHMHKSLCSTLIADSLSGTSVISIDAARLKDFQEPSPGWVVKVAASNPAYLIFTSGSTGVPKGVVVEHRAVSSSTRAFGTAMMFEPSSRVLQFASYTFDASIAEIIATLAAGGCICVPSDSDRMNNLSMFMRQTEVNWAFFTPTVIRLLHPREVSGLKTVVFGGEQLSEDIISRWRDHVTVFGGYGPTECCVFCVSINMSTAIAHSSTIGTAVGCRTWIVSPTNHNRLAPIGAVGELVIEGPILARGYLNYTSPSFFENPPWLAGTRSRLYKTGDLVQYCSDGKINYVRRKDTQVKLRGQRVELGEIEYHIRQSTLAEPSFFSDVLVDVVTPLGCVDSDVVLVAFVSEGETSHMHDFSIEGKTRHAYYLPNEIPRTKTAQHTELWNDIRRYLSNFLPRYMIPAVFIPLKFMPLSTSGKTNRQELLKFASSLSITELALYRTIEEQRRTPISEKEVGLQSLWTKTLNVHSESIGLDDDFFMLGGDSISAMRLVTAARADHLSLTVADIFLNPVLEGMSLVATSLSDTSEDEPLAPFSLLGDLEISKAIFSEVTLLCNLSRGVVLEDIYPCTALQEGFMVLSIKQPGAYIGQSVMDLSIRGIEIERFQAAWESVVQATPILRTRIVQTESAGCYQAVVNENIDWITADSLEAYLYNDQETTMDFGSRLSRFAIVTSRASGAAHFVWTCHHALYDGWSLPRILAKVDEIYYSVKSLKDSSSARTTSFAKFVKHLSETNASETESFWHSYLFEATPLQFPRPTTKHQSNTNHQSTTKHQSRPDATLSRDIHFTQATSSNITTSTLIRAAWAILISQYSGSDNVIFGATLTGRNAPVSGIDQILGPTITTVPIRVKVSGDQKLIHFLQDIQAQAIAMIPHEHIGLQNIRHISPDIQAICDFQNLLTIQPQTDTKANSESLFCDLNVAGDGLNFYVYPLTMECTLTPFGLKAHAIFNSRAIDVRQMGRTLDHFAHIIQQLSASEPGTEVRDIGIISSQDKMELSKWNETTPVAFDSCVHHLIQQVACEQPSLIAVSSWDGDVSYSELDDLSSRLACNLIGLGVHAEVFVAICFEKSLWAVIAMLGVLKAGGACACLNPVHPVSRQKAIIEDIRANIILTSEAASINITNLVDHLIVVRPLLFTTLSMNCSLESVVVGPENSAFILFTSGSTGKPKGIIHEHRTFGASVRDFGAVFQLDSSSRVLQFASFTFDVSNTDIFTTLAHGGCLCIPSEHDRMNNLAHAMRAMNVNITCLTPSVASLLTPQEVPCLRTLSTAGEAMTKEIIRVWSPHVHLVNIYGPAECAIWSTYHLQMSLDISPMNIGQSATGRCWIVCANNPEQLAPIGSVGEILIEGPHVARGYINDEEKTRTVFIPKPAWMTEVAGPNTMERFYRTGDLARYDSDGSIIYVKRNDTQVKIHGQRIELGEIEHYLTQNLSEGLRFAVDVIRPENRPDTHLLTAFISFSKTDATAHGEEIAWSMKNNLMNMVTPLKSRLAQDLPAYMIPSIYIPLETVPLTGSGKIDRRKLRQLVSKMTPAQLSALSIDNDNDRRIPTSGKEIKVQSLWAKILNIPSDSIGLDDNFFKLGGDSISAMRLVTAARAEQIILTVVNIFLKSTLEGMSQVATSLNDSKIEEPLAPFALLGDLEAARVIRNEVKTVCGLPEEKIQDVYPCTALQEGFMVLSIKQPGAYIGQSVMDLSGDIDIDRFQAAWESVIQATPIFRTRIVQTESAGCYQVVVDENIEWMAPTDSLELYLYNDQKTTMDFGSRLSRFAIVTSHTPETYIRHFVWTCHHAIYDGWSVSRILARIEKIYYSMEPGPDNRKEPVADHGVDFGAHNGVHNSIEAASFLRFVRHVSQTDSKGMNSFWRSYLSESTLCPFPRHIGQHQPLANAELFHDIHLLRPASSNITIPTLIRAAWAILVSRYSDTNDVVFGATLTGRNTPIPDIDQILGPTITTVPIRVKVNKDQNLALFLQDIQAQATAMIPYEHTGLQNIRQISSEAQAACDFQTLLIIQPQAVTQNTENTGLFRDMYNTGDLLNFSTYPLTMECVLTNFGMKANAIFDSKIIDTIQMQRILHQLAYILQQLAVCQPEEIEVQDIEIISPQDKEELFNWNRAIIPEKINTCVHHLIEQQVQAQPDRPAICSWDGNLNYSILDDLSSRLASHLVSLGVGPEVFVPLCFEKSMWTIIAMLGVLKAGGAFVPLDPSHPKQRLAFIIADVQATVTLVSPKYSNLFENSCRCVAVDAGLLDRLQRRDFSPSSAVSPSNALYLIYTSGTTSTPKGTIIEHGAYCSGAKPQAKALHLAKTSRVLQFASHSFDNSVEEMLTTLMVGGCVCIASNDDRENDLVGAMERMRVNWADLTPSSLPLLSPESVPGLEVLILGAEPLNTSNIQTWVHNTKLIGAYGQTECCITSLVNSEITIGTDPTNIGRAVGCLCWLVEPNDHNKLAPVGTRGELLIEGPILAREYFNRPNETDAAFIMDPPWLPKDGHQHRLYKTGDIVEYISDGTLKYVGRKDTQTKIRGQRLELSEVEHHLRRCIAGSKDAAADVILPTNGNANPLLVAFVCFGVDLSANGLDVKEQLAANLDAAVAELSRSLPAYMVPSIFVPLQHMPLTTSGKADRRALKKLVLDMSPEQLSMFTANSARLNAAKTISPNEEPLAMAISAKVASLVSSSGSGTRDALEGQDVVLAHTGMDSIAMIRLVTFLRKSYGIQVGIQTLYNSRMTIRGLANLIDSGKTEPLEPEHLVKFDVFKEFNLVSEEFFKSISECSASVQSHNKLVRTVFLTGGTGFLGSQILRQCLVQPDIGIVIVHVRARTIEHGVQRIIDAAKLGRWWNDALLPKLQVWIGDLSEPRLGLTYEQWQRLDGSASLSDRVDAIIHNGATVHWELDYGTLKGANVLSTLELLRASSRDGSLKFVYISGGQELSNEEEASQEDWLQMNSSSGYSQTKFISEQLVRSFSRSLNGPRDRISIIRPGLIIGSRLEGVPNVDDFIWRLVAGAISIGGYNCADVDMWLCVSSVDRVAATIVDQLLRAAGPKDFTSSIYDGITVQEFWDILTHDLHYKLQPMSHAVWLHSLQRDVEEKKEAHPLLPVLHFLEIAENTLGGEHPGQPVPQSTKDNVRAAVIKNVEYLVDVGFLPNASGEMRQGQAKAFKRNNQQNGGDHR